MNATGDGVVLPNSRCDCRKPRLLSRDLFRQEAAHSDQQKQSPRDSGLCHHLHLTFTSFFCVRPRHVNQLPHPGVQGSSNEEVVDAGELLSLRLGKSWSCSYIKSDVSHVDDHRIDVAQDDRSG